MSVTLIAPAVIVVAVGLGLAYVQPPLTPSTEVRVLSIFAVVAGLTGLSVLLGAASGAVSRTDIGSAIVSWCPALPSGHAVGLLQGLAGVSLLLLGATRLGWVLRQHLRLMGVTQGRRFTVLESSRPEAYAVPGKPGCVVVSRGLLERLTPTQRQVVLAHERAHLNLKHHRHLLAGEFATAFVPILRPLGARIRLATEIAADESALDAVDRDRVLVADTIETVASLAGSPGRVTPAFGGAAVDVRLAALAAPPMGIRRRLVGRGATVGVLVLLAVAATTQAHHLAEAVWHVCGI